jgi:hypothetical protein
MQQKIIKIKRQNKVAHFLAFNDRLSGWSA